jgi:eukaryotic-like serine/threonine-protein kinase
MRGAMQCVSDADVIDLIGGALDEIRRGVIEQHLDECAECLELVTLASRTSLAARASTVRVDTASAPRLDHEMPSPGQGALSPGTALGRYEIVEPLGRGGMGMVYAARDVQLGRRVAIKVVAPDRAGDVGSQLALLREAQALARIAQPNVLTVYDVGTSGDQVFLAAELVAGDTLEEWLRQPRRWRAVLDTFLQAARGLDAVHAAGLVHRDFKPSNVLIGQDDRVRVFDFGVVRFTDVEAVRREFAGTPIYMAPEQLRGEVADARSDQYSFCLALHEALWAGPPGEVDRPAARTFDEPPGWLRDAVRRGLEPDPERRFPTMRALIDALERGLARRRRSLWIALAGLAALAVGGSAVLAYLHGRDEPLARCAELGAPDRDAGQRARIAAAFRATALSYAATTADLVQRDLDRFVGGWRGQQQETCLASVSDRPGSRELHDRRMACLDRQWIQFEAIVDRFAHADRQIVNQVPRLVGALPDPEGCAHPPATAWPEAPDMRARVVAHVKEEAAIVSLAEAGQLDEADRRVPALVRAAGVLGSRSAQAEAGYLAGRIAGLRGRHDEAVKQVEAALWGAEASGHDALVVSAACELIHIIASRQRRPEDARRFAELARAAAERVGSAAARARAARAIGNLELIAGHFEPATVELTAALNLASSQEPPEPIMVATLEMDLANVAFQRGRAAEAERRLRLALAVFARELGEEHPRHAQALNNLGNALMDLQRSGEAARVFERAISVMERALGPDHPDVAQTRSNAIGVYLATGMFDRARQVLEKNVAVFERIDPDHPVLASTLNNLSEVRRLQGARDDAERLQRRALELRRKRLGEHHPEVTRSLISLASLAYLRGDLRTAGKRCEEAARSVEGSDADNRPMRATVETCRGEVELASGRQARAIEILERALELHAGTDDAARRADTQFALARALPRSSRARAIELAREARAALAREGAYRATDVADIDNWLARVAR